VRTTIAALRKAYASGERFAVVTAYDAPSARIVERAGLPVILVGDSVGMVVDGHPSTLPVSVDELIRHTRAVVRGCETPHIITDLPFGSYAIEDDAIRTATRTLAEGGGQSVKLEGGEAVAPTIRRLVDIGIPVVAHLGFTPQSVHALGTRVQGRDADAAAQLLRDARAVQDAGAWAVVLELVPAELAAAITDMLDIPTIGIGAGAQCSAEVQVWHDLLGFDDTFLPRHARRYLSFADEATAALKRYADDVRTGAFPGPENSSSMDPAVLQSARNAAG
jgi:3-methyl-2-oxobutanoate hydroxymethyltransferase